MAFTVQSEIHLRLLQDLENELTADSFEKLKNHCRGEQYGRFGAGQLEKIKTLYDLFQKLQKKAVFKEGDYRKLKDLLRVSENESAVERVIDAEKELFQAGYHVVGYLYPGSDAAGQKFGHLVSQYSPMTQSPSPYSQQSVAQFYHQSQFHQQYSVPGGYPAMVPQLVPAEPYKKSIKSGHQQVPLEITVMSRGQSEIHSRLLQDLGNELTGENFEKLKNHCKGDQYGRFGAGQLEKIKTPLDLFQKLQKKAVFKEGDYRKLKDLLRVCENENAVEIVKNAEKELFQAMRWTGFGSDLVQVTSYGWFLATLSAHLTASVPADLCDFFNIVGEKKNSIKSSQNPGLSLLLALDENGEIKSSEVEALWKPLTELKLVQAAAKVKEYHKQNEDRRLHFLVMSNSNLDGRRKLFIQCLRQKLKSWYETMTPVPWKKSSKWKATDLFVTCGLILTDSKSKVHPTNIDSDCKLQYGDILMHQSLKSESRLILEGEPGSGKTMLSSQLAYDWSQNKFADVELLVFLPLRFVSEMTLAEAMEKFYISDHIRLTESDLDEILESGNLETCIILDGLEEYNAKVIEGKRESSEVHKVMSKFKYPNCKVVITARSDYTQDLPACPMLKIGEFGETERNTYIEKLFPDDKVKQKEMQRVIKETPFILDLCSVPLLFVLVVHNFESINKCDEDQLEKVTPLMKSIDDTLCEQIYDNEKPGSMAERKYSKQRSALEQLAFTGLCRGSQKLSWQKDDVEEIIENVKEWIDAGILVFEDDITVKVKIDVKPEDYPVPSTSGLLSRAGGLKEKGKGTLQDSTKSGWEQKSSGSTAKQVPMRLKFLHKLFQEWFAAKHLSSEIWSLKRYSFTDELKFIDPIDLHHILQFTCYLCPPCCGLVLSHLLRMYRESVGGKKERIMDCICLCFMEHNETKGDDIKLVVREICKESIIIQSQDSRLLQHSKTEILKFASQCQIPIMNLELRDVVTAVEERIPSLTLKQDVTLTLPDSLQLVKISRWDATLNENDCRHIVDLIATSQSVKHAILELPHLPPRLEDKVLSNVADNNIKIEWEMGSSGFTLNPQTGEWVMCLKKHSSSITKAPPDDTYPDKMESEEKKPLSTSSLPGTSTDSIEYSAIWETGNKKEMIP